MNPIYEYMDYRLYLRDLFERCQKETGISWRGFNRLAGFKSSTYLKLVCEGKTRLSVVGAARIAEAFELPKDQASYLSALVTFCNSPVKKKKEMALETMQAIIKENLVRIVGNEDFNYYSHWWNPVLRELSPRMHTALPVILAGLFYDEVTSEDVRKSLDFMVEAGFLKRTRKHGYVQLDRGIQGSSEMIPMAIRNMHRKMAEFAVKAIDNFPKTERNFSGMTVAVSKSTYGQIVEELNACRKKIAEIVSAAEDGNRIFRLNMQLFPVTKEIDK